MILIWYILSTWNRKHWLTVYKCRSVRLHLNLVHIVELLRKSYLGNYDDNYEWTRTVTIGNSKSVGIRPIETHQFKYRHGEITIHPSQVLLFRYGTDNDRTLEWWVARNKGGVRDVLSAWDYYIWTVVTSKHAEIAISQMQERSLQLPQSSPFRLLSTTKLVVTHRSTIMDTAYNRYSIRMTRLLWRGSNTREGTACCIWQGDKLEIINYLGRQSLSR